MLQNLDNYGPYREYAQGLQQTIYTKDITVDNVDQYFNSIINILKDGIETRIVSHNFITYVFDNGEDVELSLSDSYLNIIMWKLICISGSPILPEHLIFEEDFTAALIGKYINRYLIIPHRKDMENMKLNNIIDDVLFLFKNIDLFSMYLANTANLEDYIDLMNSNPEVYNILHADLSQYPLEDVNKVANQLNSRLVDIIKASDNHCFKDSFKAKEAINVKQHREYAVAGGTKPNGIGGVFNRIINSNYIVNGLQNMEEHYIEENSGRTAQILSKTNVSDSGHFARLLGLNNQDTVLHEDPEYDCGTKNYEEITIVSSDMLSKYISRYYRLYPDGMEKMLDGTESNLIGKKIYLRSPIKCKSFAEGRGICYKCYGDVAYTNADINIGKIAAELLSSELTQRLLSAKHLLESFIKTMKWVEMFGEYFILDGDLISIRDDLEDYKNKYIIIDNEDIHLENEYEKSDYNEYTCQFSIRDSEFMCQIYTDDADDMFISPQLSSIIEKYTDIDGIATIPFDDLLDLNLFKIQIHNNGLAETLKRLKDIIDKNEVTKRHDANSILQTFMETVCEGGIGIDSIHAEIIIANQVRLGDTNDTILEKPNWDKPNNEEYTILTLSRALNNHPSITISLSYERIKRALYTPLTYKKRQPSFMDLFFMPKPYDIIGSNSEYKGDEYYTEGLVVPAKIIKRDKDTEQ